MREIENLQIKALEMLLEIFERQSLSAKLSTKKSILQIYLADLNNYHFKYRGAEDMRFFEVIDLLRKKDAGLVDFKANDPDLLQWEYDMRNSEKMRGKSFTPAYEISVSKSFTEKARGCINDLRMNAVVNPKQIRMRWEPTRFQLSRSDSNGYKPYPIRKGRGGTDMRRTVMSELFKNFPNETTVSKLLKITGLTLEKFKDHVSKLNATIETKLDVSNRDLILHNDDWTKVGLNQTDFHLEN